MSRDRTAETKGQRAAREQLAEFFGPPPELPKFTPLKIHRAAREFSEQTTGEYEVSDDRTTNGP